MVSVETNNENSGRILFKHICITTENTLKCVVGINDMAADAST